MMIEEPTLEELLDRVERAVALPMGLNQLQTLRATLASAKEALDNRAKRPYRRLSLVRRADAANT